MAALATEAARDGALEDDLDAAGEGPFTDAAGDGALTEAAREEGTEGMGDAATVDDGRAIAAVVARGLYSAASKLSFTLAPFATAPARPSLTRTSCRSVKRTSADAAFRASRSNTCDNTNARAGP